MLAVRIIGPGRGGRSLGAALSASGWSVDYLGRSDPVEHACAGVDLVVIATPDATIASIAERIAPTGPEGAVVAHLAGSLGLDVLAPHDRRAAVHPLVALPNPEVGADRLRGGAWFAVAGDPLARSVVAALGGRWFEVADDDRVLYHAAACIASNHLVALLGQAERIGAQAGVPLEAYLDLVRATVENVATLGPVAAVTGPAARGDWGTVARHREALDALDAGERRTYDAMVAAVRRLVDGTWPEA